MSNTIKIYVDNLIAFRGHLMAQFDTNDDDQIDEFHNASFTISFMGKSVQVWNSPEVFENITNMLEANINEWEVE